MKKIVSLLLLILSVQNSMAQEKTSWTKEHISFGGYIKYSDILIFHDANDLTSNNLWHNRLNFDIYFNDYVSFKAGLRNRIYYGDWLNMPSLKTGLKQDNGILDLTASLLDKQRLFEVSNLDRLLLDFTFKKTEITLGRQRINWGTNTVWNPTDIFNTANFLDMDYPEKPGVDALRFSYDINGMSSLEFAFTSNKEFERDKDIWAMKYAGSTGSNDYQLQAGKYLDYFYSGIAWAGNIKKIGMKTEWSFFYKKDKQKVVGSMEGNYAFKNGINWIMASLYNGAYEDMSLSLALFSGQSLDALHLFPSRWAFYNQFSGNIGPAWTWSAGVLYGNQNNLTVLIPAIHYSISDNWEINLFMQSFFADIPGLKQTNFLNFRLRWYF